VRKATENTGVTAAYKKMIDKVGFGQLGALGTLGGLAKTKESLDLDSYVTHKAMDGLFSRSVRKKNAFARIRRPGALRLIDVHLVQSAKF
jgi:hypothetical protein